MSQTLSFSSVNRVDDALLRSLQEYSSWSYADVRWCLHASAAVFTNATSPQLQAFLSEETPPTIPKVIVMTSEHIHIVDTNTTDKRQNRVLTLETMNVASMVLPQITKALPNGDEISFRSSSVLLAMSNGAALYVEFVTNSNRGEFVDTLCEIVQATRGAVLDVETHDVRYITPWLDLFFPSSFDVAESLQSMWKHTWLFVKIGTVVNRAKSDSLPHTHTTPSSFPDTRSPEQNLLCTHASSFLPRLVEDEGEQHNTAARPSTSDEVLDSSCMNVCGSNEPQPQLDEKCANESPPVPLPVANLGALASKPTSPVSAASDLRSVPHHSKEDGESARAESSALDLPGIAPDSVGAMHCQSNDKLVTQDISGAVEDILRRLGRAFSNRQARYYKLCSNNTRHRTRLILRGDILQWTRRTGLWHRGLPLSQIRYIARGGASFGSRAAHSSARLVDRCVSIVWHERELNLECEVESHCSAIAALIEEYMLLIRTVAGTGPHKNQAQDPTLK